MMKKLLMMIAALAMFALPVKAQDFEVVDFQETVGPKKQKLITFSLGPKVDFNYALAGNPEGMNIDMKGGAGFNAGAVANLRFGRPVGRPVGTERFGAQLELLYSMRNLNNKVDNITLNAIEIPLLFQWYFIPQLAIEVGPTFSYSFSTSPGKMEINNKMYKLGNPFDLMVTFGLNCQLGKGFMAEARYNLGTSNINNNFKTKVSTISIGVGWLFNIVK